MATDRDIVRILASVAALSIGSTTDAILGATRGTPQACEARQAIYYTCKIALGWTEQRIGHAFNRKQHTISHGLRAVEDRRKDGSALDARMALLENAAAAISATANHSLKKAA